MSEGFFYTDAGCLAAAPSGRAYQAALRPASVPPLWRVHQTGKGGKAAKFRATGERRAEEGGDGDELRASPSRLTRADIANLVADFLRRGGAITHCPEGGSGEKLPHYVSPFVAVRKQRARRARMRQRRHAVKAVRK